MSDTVHIVVVDNGDTEPELWAFEDLGQAQRFEGVRGASHVQTLAVFSEAEAKRLIEAEARERREEERVDRWLEEH